jgi:hypothetical protein
VAVPSYDHPEYLQYIHFGVFFAFALELPLYFIGIEGLQLLRADGYAVIRQEFESWT